MGQSIVEDIATILRLDMKSNSINLDEISMFNCEAWDSLAHLKIVTLIECYIDRKLQPDEVIGLISIKDIKALKPSVKI
jgi:acyl carrier protein